MSRILHSIATLTGTSLAQEDRLISGHFTLSHAAGGSAGAAVTATFTGALPAAYNVQGTPSQDATVWISAKTQAGFTVNIAPRLAASTLAAGTVDIRITA